MERRDIFESVGIIFAAARGQLLFALLKFGFIKCLIDIFEGGCGRNPVKKIIVKVGESVVSGKPGFVIADRLCGRDV